jgi:hypothetical protein
MKPNRSYRALFNTPYGQGAGVVYYDGSKVDGGDAGYYYGGPVSIVGDSVSATITVLRHTAGHVSVFGNLAQFTLKLTGKVQGDSAKLTGTSPQVPNVTITIELSLIAAPVPA